MSLDYEVPPLLFSVSKRDSKGNVAEYQKLIVGQGKLDDIICETTKAFKGTGRAKWSLEDANYLDFENLENSLPVSRDPETGAEKIDLSPIGKFPTLDKTKICVLHEGEIYTYDNNNKVYLTDSEKLDYSEPEFGDGSVEDDETYVNTIGPKLKNFKKIVELNGIPVKKETNLTFKPDKRNEIKAMAQTTNIGNDIARNAALEIFVGPYFEPDVSKLPPNCVYSKGKIIANIGACAPGEKKRVYLTFKEKPDVCSRLFDANSVIEKIRVRYRGNLGLSGDEPVVYRYADNRQLRLEAPDMALSDFEADKTYLKRGSEVNLTAKVKNGTTKIQNAVVKIYAKTIDGKEIILGEEKIENLNPNEEYVYSVSYKLEDSVDYVEFYASAYYGESGCEICERNNTKKLNIPIEGPNWILNVKNYPNPVFYKSYFSYFLPREIQKLDLVIYNLDGSEIARIENCPRNLGQNEVLWQAPNIPKGAYVFSFEGTDKNGKPLKYKGTIVKN